MIVPDEQKIAKDGHFDSYAGISSPPPSYAELTNQPGGHRQAMPNPHAHSMHATSLPPPRSPHETYHHHGRFQTMPEPSHAQPSQDMATHLQNVRYQEEQKVRVDEQRRESVQVYSAQMPSLAPLPSQNMTLPSLPIQSTGTSTDKSFDALNPNPSVPPHSQVRTQPSFQKSMDVRNARQMPALANGDRAWSHGCCNSMCGACGTCCLATFCPCVVYSTVKSRLSFLERNNYPHPSGGECCTSDCFVHGLLTSLCGVGWVMQIGLRSSIRDRYRVDGNGCGDCMCSWCCTPCSLAQESLEVQEEEQALMGTGKWAKPLPGTP